MQKGGGRDLHGGEEGSRSKDERQSGQLNWHLSSHFSRHSAWNKWPHLGSLFTESSPSNSTRQIEHISSSLSCNSRQRETGRSSSHSGFSLLWGWWWGSSRKLQNLTAVSQIWSMQAYKITTKLDRCNSPYTIIFSLSLTRFNYGNSVWKPEMVSEPKPEMGCSLYRREMAIVVYRLSQQLFPGIHYWFSSFS